MSLISYKRGQASIVLRVKILDSSVSTGAGKTGLTSATSGLIISTIADNEATATAYTVAGSTIESITTLGTYAAPTATKCRFKEVDSTNHKGVYEIHIADARFAVSNAKSLLVSISGATGAAETDCVVPLTDVDPYDAVRGGMTAMPNAAAGANGGLPLSVDASGRVDVLKVNGTSQTARDIGASVLLSAGTGTGQLDFTNGVVKSNLAQILGTALTETAGQIAGAFKKFFNVATPTGTVNSIPDAIPGAAGGIFIAGTNAATTITTSLTTTFTGNLTGSVGSVTGNVGGNVTGSVGSVATGGITSASFGAGAITASAIAADAIGASELATDAVTEIAAAVWDLTTTGHTNAGTFGEAMNAAGAAGDPWTTSLPGAYGAGSAGYIIGTNIDATISSRGTGTALDAAGVRTAVGLASANLDTQLTAIAGYVDTEVAAIKAKTDNLPASPAATGDIPTTAQIATAIFTDLLAGSDFATASSFGKLVKDNLDAAVSSRLATAGYTAPLDAAGTRTAVGLASANLDTQLAAIAGYIDTEVAAILAAVDTEVAAIKAKTDNLPATPAATGDAMTLTSGERDAVAAALLDLAAGVETNRTLRQALRLILAAAAGKLSGAATTSVVIRDTNDSKDRITATVDADGNRSAVTLDAT